MTEHLLFRKAKGKTSTEVVSYSVSRLLLLRSVYSIYVSSEKTTTTLSREEVERTEKERVYTTYILQRKRKREEESLREKTTIPVEKKRLIRFL